MVQVTFNFFSVAVKGKERSKGQWDGKRVTKRKRSVKGKKQGKWNRGQVGYCPARLRPFVSVF